MVQVNKATEREQKTVAQVRKAESRVKKIAGPVKKASGPVKATAEQLKTDTGRAVRGTGKFKCDHCGTRTARKCDLERHINRMHRGVYVTEFYLLPWPHAYTQHFRSFQCARCGIEFGQQHNLAIHELTRYAFRSLVSPSY